MNEFEFIDLGQFAELKDSLELNELIEFKKKFNEFLKESQKNAKQDVCYYCKTECKGFCNSHTTPAFCLRYLSNNGKLYHINTLVGLPVLKEEVGVNESGTFHIICRDCDSKIFQEYENENNFQKEISVKLLAQIELKNYLKLIDKNLLEKSTFLTLIKNKMVPEFLMTNKLMVNSLNRSEFEINYNCAKRSSLKPFDGDYYVGINITLPYRIPVAFQGAIAIIKDLKGMIINNIYDMNPKYKVKNINVCLFPMKDKSVILLFVERNNNRYKDFFKQLNSLPVSEQLKVINYIVFAYAEDYFMSPNLSKDIIESLKLMASKSTELLTVNPMVNCLEEAKNHFNYEEMNSITNLLSEEYSINT